MAKRRKGLQHNPLAGASPVRVALDSMQAPATPRRKRPQISTITLPAEVADRLRDAAAYERMTVSAWTSRVVLQAIADLEREQGPIPARRR